MNAPLRIALSLDHLDVAAWQYSAIEQIIQLDCAEIVWVALAGRPQPQVGFGRVLKQNWHEAGYYLLDKLDRKLFARHPDALAAANLAPLLAGIPIITGDDLARDPLQPIDILAHFGRERPHPRLLQTARFGVWTYRFGEAKNRDDAPPGFWETAENRPVTGVGLQMMDEQAHEKALLHQSWFPTYPFSPAMNRQLHLWTASQFMAREIARLHTLGAQAFFQRTTSPPQAQTPAPARGIPGNIDVIKTAVRLAYRIMARKISDLLYWEQWVMLYQFQDEEAHQFGDFKKIVPPPERYWADPQILRQDDQYAILFEDYEYKTDKGRLAVIEVDEADGPSQATVILEKATHLSYPFLFSWDHQRYMIPESAANRTIDLYECSACPREWRFKMHLMQDIRAADATLLRHNDKWWLFATVAAVPGSSLNYELFLFFADDFATTAWTPHPLNPIVTDVRHARPAGRIFERSGKLIRPAQNSARGYGRSITLNEIIRLTETDYEERPIDVIRPDWDKNVIGVHTFQRVGRLTVIDALIRRKRWLNNR